jgi:multidrug efflux pump subunit AcrA (membrane-fusion protein)
VILPFKGTITAVLTQAGQKVKAGEILARYLLAPESRLEIQRRLSPPEIKDLEMRLAGFEKDKAELETKRREEKQLAEQNLSSPQSTISLNRELNTLSKQQNLGKERLQQLQSLTKADGVYLKEQLGKFIESGQVPHEAAIISPINGYVLWVQPELRTGAELGPGTAAFVVGVLDPIIVKADVHELEATQLALGDKAEVTVDSLPDRKFTAQISRLSLTPINASTEQPSYYQVEFTVPNRDLALKDGLKARITVRK